MQYLKHLILVTSVITTFLFPVTSIAEVLKMQTFLGPTASTTKAFEEMAARLKKETNGEVQIQVFPGNTVVNAAETIDAIENGLLDGHYTAPTYFAGKDPALGVLGDTLSAYPDSVTRDKWFKEGRGLEIARALYAKHGLFFVGPVYWPEEQIPSMVPIRSVKDFKGLKMRSPGGMPSDLLTLAGASMVKMGVGESVSAMETGVLDATDLANVALNVALGMHNKAKYSILARHSMPTTEVSITLAKWNRLSPAKQQKIIDAVAWLNETLRKRLTDEDKAAIKRAKNELDVEFIEFGKDDAATFRTMLLKVWDKWAKKSNDSKVIIDSHKDYLKKLGLL